MHQRLLVPAIVLLVVAGSSAVAQDSDAKPKGPDEKVTVTLVQVDTLVIDKKGASVPNLTKDDFQLSLGAEPLEIATLDVNCEIGATADPLPIKGKTPPPLVGPGVKRRIVFAFDYHFLEITMRPQILRAARSMLQFAKTDEEEIMIVALAYGVRIEQRFTSDLRLLEATLVRLEHDVSLWARLFPLGATGEGYFDDLVTLMDVLDGYDGSKAIVMFSQAVSITAAMPTLYYNNVAMHALAARASIYPANPDLMLGKSAAANGALVQLANQSGGRMPFFTSDVSLPYRQAQRDMSCRYTLGAYLNPEQGGKRRQVHVRPTSSKHSTRHPQMIKLFTDEEKQENRSRAAYLDPGPYENPLVRAWAYPLYPATANKWDTMLAVTFPMPVEANGADITVGSTLRREALRIDKSKRTLHVDPPPGGGGTRDVTIFGDTTIKDGNYRLNVVLTEPAKKRLVSAEVSFQVPPVFTDLLILRGPIFARAVSGGLLAKGDPKDKGNDTKLDEFLGEGKSFEPLIVNEIEASDELLYYWNACVIGKLDLKGDLVVKRTLMTEAGDVVHQLDQVPLKLEPQERNKKAKCHVELGSVPPNTIPPGEYEVDIVIAYENGDLVSHGRAPLHVKPAAP